MTYLSEDLTQGVKVIITSHHVDKVFPCGSMSLEKKNCNLLVLILGFQEVSDENESSENVYYLLPTSVYIEDR